MNMPLLKIINLEAWYGKLKILHGINIEVNQGELVSIIGPNGSGKSTVLKSIAGVIQKKRCKILLDDKLISRKQPHEVTRMGISYVPQGRRVFSRMTVEENLEMGGFILDSDVMKERLNDVYRFLPEMRKWKSKRATFLSGGQQQILSIGRALMLKPRILLLDEPSLGLSPQAIKNIFNKIIEINKRGTAIIIVEQNTCLALSICDKAYVIDLGKNKLIGKGKKLLKDKNLSKLCSIFL